MDEIPSRREADRILSKINEKLDRIPELVSETISAGNFKLPDGRTPEELLAEHNHFEATTKRIIAALDGPEVTLMDGTRARLTEQGLVYQSRENGKRLGKIERTLSNGIRTQWPVEVKVAVIAAAGTVIAALGPAVWERLFG